MSDYRPNVAALLLSREGKILVCERAGEDGAWQFPQGGIDKGESPLDALYREVEEEVGIKAKHFKVVEFKTGYRYDFPGQKQLKKGYKGQEQTYFLCLMRHKIPKPKLGGEDAEFQNYKWIRPKKFKSSWLPDWKLKVYKSVLKDFFGLSLKG